MWLQRKGYNAYLDVYTGRLCTKNSFPGFLPVKITDIFPQTEICDGRFYLPLNPHLYLREVTRIAQIFPLRCALFRYGGGFCAIVLLRVYIFWLIAIGKKARKKIGRPSLQEHII